MSTTGLAKKLESEHSDEVLELVKRHYTPHEVEITSDFWKYDIWIAKELESVGVRTSVAVSPSLHFKYIKNPSFREELKKYFRERLLGAKNFSLGTANQYLLLLTRFFNYISYIKPSWNDLNELDRECFLSFIEDLRRTYDGDKINNYLLRRINILRTFLLDIQLRNYDMAPKIDINKLILETDKPKKISKSLDSVDYIPDSVLEQLF